MPLGGMPILEIVVRQLRAAGVRDVTFAVGYLAELIQTFFGDGGRFDVDISYSREQVPLGTAGPIRLAADSLHETFLVMNGDVLTTIDFGRFIDCHRSQGNVATIAVFSKKVQIDLGVLHLDHADAVTDYVEKPELEYAVSTGMYVFEPAVLQYLPEGRFDLPDLIRALIAAGQRVGGYRFDGEWLDIGRPEDFAEASARFEARRDEFLPGRLPIDAG
jgi:NDP-mannose synthase